MECSIFFIGDLMKVYLDLLFILNFLLDFIILSAVNYILRRNVKQGRILLGSLIGTVTLLILFIKLSNFELLLYKLIIVAKKHRVFRVLNNKVRYRFKKI